MVDDAQLDLLDRDRLAVDRQHARVLTRRRAQRPRELGKIVRGVQLLCRALPSTSPDEVIPSRDQIAQRTSGVTERHPTIHAPARLQAYLVGGERLVHVSPVL
jgi:hypothetical protein